MWKSAMWKFALCAVAGLVTLVSGASSGSSSGSSSGTTSGGITNAQWASMLEVAELQGMLTQRMSTEFLLIAYGVDVITNRQHLAKSIKEFDDTLKDLLNGNAARNIVPPMSARVQGELDIIEAHWTDFKYLLETNLNTVQADSLDVLAAVESQNERLLHDSELAVSYYQDYARAAGATLPSMAVGIAERQRIYIAKMCKEALFIGLHLKTEHYLEELTHTMHLFIESHEGLVRGIDFVGLAELTSHCTLNEMVKVNHYWDEMRPILQKVIDDKGASEELLTEMEHVMPTLDHEMELAVHLFQHDDGSCTPIPNIDKKGWTHILEEAGMQRMLVQKASRIFFQIAKKVNVQQGRVDLGTTLTAASKSLRYCIEGSYDKNIPAPMTQPIADQLILAWAHFQLFDEYMRLGAEQSEIDAFTVNKIRDLSYDALNEMTHAVDMYVHEALVAKPELPSIVIEIADRQLTFLQKMSKEALLVSLGNNKATNEAAFAATTNMFEVVHWELLYGVEPQNGNAPAASSSGGHRRLATSSSSGASSATSSSATSSSATSSSATSSSSTATSSSSGSSSATASSGSSSSSGGLSAADLLLLQHGVPRTTDSCTLTQMLTVLDRYTELKALLQPVANGDLKDAEEMTALEQMDALSPVAFTAMNTAVHYYAAGHASCTIVHAAAVWEMGLREIGRASQYFQKAAKEFYLTSMGVELYGNDNLDYTVHKLDHELDQLKFGNTSSDIPPPPTQAVADALFLVGDKWTLEKQLLLAEPDADGVDHIAEAEDMFMDAAAALSQTMIDAAWNADRTVQATKISKAGRQIMLIEKMLKEAVLITMGHESATAELLGATVQEYEDGHKLLMDGNQVGGSASGSASGSSSAARRMAAALTSKEDVPATTERAIVSQMNAVQDKFAILKTKLEKVIETGTANTEELQDMVAKAHYVEAEMDDALVYYVSHTRTTTSVPIDILAPVPLSGDWDAGRTMRVSALIAQGLINDEQRILPGYAIKTAFFDDQCDTQMATQIVLEQVASKDSYVALGGMGCSAVCESTAFVASSMRMPFLSYECAGNTLSDTETYPDFTRFGTMTSNVPDIIKDLSAQFNWESITVLSGDPATYRPEAEALQTALADLNIMSDYVNSYNDDWNAIQEMMMNLKAQKKRVLYVMSTEAFFRKVICASILAESNIGITWMSEGNKRHQWWLEEDPVLLGLEPTCTPEKIAESYEGAINFAGLGQPVAEDMQKPLTCFASQTAESFLALIDTHLAEGYPSGDNVTEVDKPHNNLKAHAADGTCVFMYTVKYLLEEMGKTIDEIRRPDGETYDEFLRYIKTQVDFDGVSGRVKFSGNDKPAYLALRQVQAGEEKLVGAKWGNNTLDLSINDGPTNESWNPAFPDPPPPPSNFPYWAFQAFIPILCVCCPAIAGCIRHG